MNWFNTKEVDEFASTIIAELVKRVPPTAQNPEKKLLEKLGKSHDVLLARAADFVSSRNLNIYQKARLGNRFKWGLTEAGYPKNFVDTWTYELVTFVTLKSRGQAK